MKTFLAFFKSGIVMRCQAEAELSAKIKCFNLHHKEVNRLDCLEQLQEVVEEDMNHLSHSETRTKKDISIIADFSDLMNRGQEPYSVVNRLRTLLPSRN